MSKTTGSENINRKAASCRRPPTCRPLVHGSVSGEAPLQRSSTSHDCRSVSWSVVAVRGREALAEQIHELAAVGLLLDAGGVACLTQRGRRDEPRRWSQEDDLLQATMVSSERLRW